MKNLEELNPRGIMIIIILLSLLLTGLDSILAQEAKTSLDKEDKDTLTTKKPSWEGLSLTFLTGETSLTKGNTFTGVWKRGKSVLIADINDELGEFMYLYYPKKWFSIGPSVGFLWGRPYIGPIGTLELYKNNFSFKTLDWFGWDFGNAIDTCSFLFSYHQLTLAYKIKDKVLPEVYYALQHFKGEPEHLFGAKLTFNLNKTWSVFGGWGYMLKADYHLWSCGVNLNL
jgi:hypothetical protein